MNFNNLTWAEIYEKQAPKLLGICRRYIRCNAKAEDIMHDAFIQAMEKIDTYKGSGSFEGWLQRIVINTALQYLRNNKNVEILVDILPEKGDFFDSTEISPKTERMVIELADFKNNELLDIIDQLPEHHKLVFNLYVIDGYLHKEIGEMLNISEGTSKSHLARARKKLKQLLFEKANEKNKKKRFLFCIPFFSKANYVDNIYKDAFKSFEIKPIKNPNFSNADKIINIPHKSFLIRLLSHKLFISVSIVTIITVPIIFFIFNNKNPSDSKSENSKPILNDNSKFIDSAENKIDMQKVNKDTLIVEKKTTTIPTSYKKIYNSDKGSVKVVVKKKIVVNKDTIKRDTVYK